MKKVYGHVEVYPIVAVALVGMGVAECYSVVEPYHLHEKILQLDSGDASMAHHPKI